MKTVITIALSLLSLCIYASDIDLNQLIDSRESRLTEYKQLQDSLITNKVVKYTLLNEKLLSINSLDSTIISEANNEIAALNDSIKNLTGVASKLRSDVDRLQERTVNDLRMMLILKVAAAILIVTILILIYFLATRKTKAADRPDAEISTSEMHVDNDGYLREIERLKAKEHYLIEEHEQGMKVQQEQYNLLSAKLAALEVEYNQLKESVSDTSVNLPLKGEESHEIKQENEKLLSQVNSLKAQLDDSRAKNQAILRKIDKLISDLSGVNSAS